MASGDKLALAAVAGLAFISALSRKRRGARNDADQDEDEDDAGEALEQGYHEHRTEPFSPDDGFPTIAPISADQIRYRMSTRPHSYTFGRVFHVIDEEAISLSRADEERDSEDVYNALEDEDYVYIPAPGVNIYSVLSMGPKMKKAMEIREIVLPKDYPSTRAGQVVDAVFFNTDEVSAAIFLDGQYRYFGHSTHWLNMVIDYLDRADQAPRTVIDLLTTMYQLLNERGDLDSANSMNADALRRAVRLFEYDSNMLTAAVLSILLGEGLLDREDLKPARVLNLLREVGRDALAQVQEAFPEGFEPGVSPMGRPTVTMGGVRLPFVLPNGSRSTERRRSS